MSEITCDVCRAKAVRGIIYAAPHEKMLGVAAVIAAELFKWAGDDNSADRPRLVDTIVGHMRRVLFGFDGVVPQSEGFRVCHECLVGAVDQLDAEESPGARLEVTLVGGDKAERAKLSKALADGFEMLTNPMAWAARRGAELGAQLSRKCANKGCHHAYTSHKLAPPPVDGEAPPRNPSGGSKWADIGARLRGPRRCSVDGCGCESFEEEA